MNHTHNKYKQATEKILQTNIQTIMILNVVPCMHMNREGIGSVPRVFAPRNEVDRLVGDAIMLPLSMALW